VWVCQLRPEPQASSSEAMVTLGYSSSHGWRGRARAMPKALGKTRTSREPAATEVTEWQSYERPKPRFVSPHHAVCCADSSRRSTRPVAPRAIAQRSSAPIQKARSWLTALGTRLQSRPLHLLRARVSGLLRAAAASTPMSGNGSRACSPPASRPSVVGSTNFWDRTTSFLVWRTCSRRRSGPRRTFSAPTRPRSWSRASTRRWTRCSRRRSSGWPSRPRPACTSSFYGRWQLSPCRA
jgi:hypothetical protein